MAFTPTLLSAQEQECLRGVNVSGAEFGGYQGEYGQKYIYPSDKTLDWAAARHMTAIRLPFRWERLQPRLFDGFDAAELERLKDTVARANARGLTVILDPHNYAKYRDQKLGSGDVSPEAFADFWKRLASMFAGNDRIVFGLMNEPSGITAMSWFDSAQAGLSAIREAGAQNLVLVPGTIWTGASHWFEAQEGGSNAEILQRISDPSDNFAFEFHQYMDADFSGTNETCPRVDDALSALEDVSKWMRNNDYRGFLGEFGGTSAPECLNGLMQMAGYMNRNSDIWIGWSAWAAGEWWGKYPLSLQPVGSVDKPQMRVLLPYLTNAGQVPLCNFR
ncbi:glycoside hydrolase family 5 protein [Roseibium salinum]|uniref:Glycoside hydrolase family 5 protein n=2 Tax=Roseibium salinum TaxID=1604349 RepID=A0ABT3R5A6_9HYPH|nr:glycoside hydrolase family 5 protein [Roseibium sp. DSM 29163]MCX2724235.1 glycoside hydrolase family 5 protein [Roseibium sp. DSM 29163]